MEQKAKNKNRGKEKTYNDELEDIVKVIEDKIKECEKTGNDITGKDDKTIYEIRDSSFMSYGREINTKEIRIKNCQFLSFDTIIRAINQSRLLNDFCILENMLVITIRNIKYESRKY